MTPCASRSRRWTATATSALALNGSYIDAMLDKTKRIFLEVNDRQPRGLCGSLIHISQVDAIVEYNHDLPVLPPVQLDEVSKTIGGLIAERIPDGACLQLGIGAIPDATGMALKAKHDLGIHTEMFTDSMVELIECGAVNSKSRSTAARPSRRLPSVRSAFMTISTITRPSRSCRSNTSTIRTSSARTTT